MTGILNPGVTNEKVNDFLARAIPLGRFGWRDYGEIHALVFNANPKQSLYKIKVGDPSSNSFLLCASAGEIVDVRNFLPIVKERIKYSGIDEAREASLRDIVGKLQLDDKTEGCAAFEISLAYHIGDNLVSDVNLYSRRQ